MSILGKDDNAWENVELYKDDKSEEQDIKRDYRNLVSKSLDIRSCIKDGLSRHTLHNKLFICKLSTFWREVTFGEQVFPTGKLILDIKYPYLGSQKDNLFHLFNNQLDYILAIYLQRLKLLQVT